MHRPHTGSFFELGALFLYLNNPVGFRWINQRKKTKNKEIKKKHIHVRLSEKAVNVKSKTL